MLIKLMRGANGRMLGRGSRSVLFEAETDFVPPPANPKQPLSRASERLSNCTTGGAFPIGAGLLGGRASGRSFGTKFILRS
jgi:hypothetical protein